MFQELDEGGVQELLKKNVKLQCALTLEPGAVVYVLAGWHLWRQNGGSGTSIDCKDIVCYEFHCMPGDCVTPPLD